jgi:SulP family sulfate permease
VFLSFGIFYIITGYYYKLPVPVQPLKAVGAIAIAYPAQITEPVIAASGIIFGGLLMVLSLTGMVDRLAKLFTQPVVRGIQLALGLIFLRKGVDLILTQNLFGSGLPGKLAGYPVNLILGFIVFALVLALLDNKKVPAALAALAVGIIAGLSLGGLGDRAFSIGPTKMNFILPSTHDFWLAFIMLILPQIPLTIGNACVGTADTCQILFPGNPLLEKTKAGKFALTMGIVNLPAGFFGAVPMCHGTGGLAAHYRFGARTGGAPIMIGVFLVVVALILGDLG